MGGPNGAQPAPPLAQLLGAQWEPGTMSWSWLKANAPTGRLHLLVLETPAGRLAFAFSETDLEAFIRSAQTQLTGLVLPGPGEVQL